MPEDAQDIETLRARIEALDLEVIRLFGERMGLVRKLGRWKALSDEPIENAQRESQLRSLYMRAAEREGLDPALVLRVFEAVLQHSKAVQRSSRGRRPKTA